MDKLKSIIKQVMKETSTPAYKGPVGYDDGCDCYPADELFEESGTGGGASAGAFSPGEGSQTATKAGTDAAYKKNTNSKGTTNNYYYKLGYKPVNQKKLNKQAKGIEVKQMWKENVNEAQLDVDAYIDSLNIDKPELKTLLLKTTIYMI